MREADDRAVLELALIENFQRENLNALEEAHGYAQLAEQFQLTQEEIALKVGKSRAAVANATRLLKLPAAVQKFVREGRISVGHAKVILGLADEKNQNLAAERIIKDGLNVRQTEGLVAKLQSRGSRVAAAKPETVAAPIGDPHVADLEAKLREVFATKVHLNYAQGKGALEISFFSDDGIGAIAFLQIILGVKADINFQPLHDFEIVKYGHPALRQKGAAIENITPEIKQLIADMFETMEASHGVGLAAQQVGVAMQLTVIDVREAVKDRPSTLELDGQPADVAEIMPLVLINPEVTPAGEMVTGSEGCLSFPEIFAEISRAGISGREGAG